MNNPNSDSKLQTAKTTLQTRETKTMTLSKIVRSLPIIPAISALYISAGLLIDAVPFPGVALFHGNEIENSTIKGYAPSGNTGFKALDLHRDVSGVSDEESRTAQELAGSDKILDKQEIQSACKALEGQNDKIDSLNNILVDIRNGKISNVRLSSWNVKGCSQKVSN